MRGSRSANRDQAGRRVLHLAAELSTSVGKREVVLALESGRMILLPSPRIGGLRDCRKDARLFARESGRLHGFDLAHESPAGCARHDNGARTATLGESFDTPLQKGALQNLANLR